MREIKFRAWHEKDGMFIVEGFDFPDKSVIHPNGLNYYECKIMQFTGLKDRRGKEIYEGDIVQQKMPSGEVQFGTVVFNRGGFMISEPKPKHIYCKELIGEFTEIMGNRFENPELLGRRR